VPRFPLAAALAATALVPAAAGCGDDEPTPERAVRAKLGELVQATRDKRWSRLCDSVFAASLVDSVERAGLPCEAAMERALGDVRGAELTIGRIRVTGARASAEIRTAAQGQAPSRDIVRLVRGRDGWRVSELVSASPPAPSP
jgi:hypothetical protein